VIKVQQGHEADLTIAEAEKIEPWKKVDPNELSAAQELEEPVVSIFELRNLEREHKKRKCVEGIGTSAYDPAIKECVGGSAAEAERLWSMAGHVLTEHRASWSPLIFELIMYLKYNNRLWNLSDVIEANKRRKNESPAAKKRLDIQMERLEFLRAEVAEWERL
jgi:hypothetical protein